MTRLALLHLAILTTLMMDPSAETGIGSVLGRDHAVATQVAVGLEIVETVPPSRLVGVPNEANRFKLGDAVKVRVASVNLEEAKIDFEWVRDKSNGDTEKSKKRKKSNDKGKSKSGVKLTPASSRKSSNKSSPSDRPKLAKKDRNRRKNQK